MEKCTYSANLQDIPKEASGEDSDNENVDSQMDSDYADHSKNDESSESSEEENTGICYFHIFTFVIYKISICHVIYFTAFLKRMKT